MITFESTHLVYISFLCLGLDDQDDHIGRVADVEPFPSKRCQQVYSTVQYSIIELIYKVYKSSCPKVALSLKSLGQILNKLQVSINRVALDPVLFFTGAPDASLI
jgi:hypothetical protein